MADGVKINDPCARYLAGQLTCAICKINIQPTGWEQHIRGQLHNDKVQQLQRLVQLGHQQPQQQKQPIRLINESQEEPTPPTSMPHHSSTAPTPPTSITSQIQSSTTMSLGLDEYSDDDDDDNDTTSTIPQPQQLQQPINNLTTITQTPQSDDDELDIDIDSIEIPGDWDGDPDDYIEQYIANYKANKSKSTTTISTTSTNSTTTSTIPSQTTTTATTISTNPKVDDNANLDEDGNEIIEFVDDDGDTWRVTANSEIIFVKHGDKPPNHQSTSNYRNPYGTVTTTENEKPVETDDKSTTTEPMVRQNSYYHTSYSQSLATTIHMVKLSTQNENIDQMTILGEMRKKRKAAIQLHQSHINPPSSDDDENQHLNYSINTTNSQSTIPSQRVSLIKQHHVNQQPSSELMPTSIAQMPCELNQNTNQATPVSNGQGDDDGDDDDDDDDEDYDDDDDDETEMESGSDSPVDLVAVHGWT